MYMHVDSVTSFTSQINFTKIELLKTSILRTKIMNPRLRFYHIDRSKCSRINVPDADYCTVSL